VLSFFSSRPNWDSATPQPQASVSPPPHLVPGKVPSLGGTDSLAGEGVGGPSSDEGTDAVVL
jgi:hypothetical protein